MPNFEFDKAKSESNLQKHGIDFKTAIKLWNDPELLEIHAGSKVEDRCLLIGKIDGKHWSAVVTYREEKVRIISVGRSCKKEVELYES